MKKTDKAPPPSFAPSEPVTLSPEEIEKALSDGVKAARELDKRIRKMEQPPDIEGQLRRAEREIEKLNASNRELIATMRDFRASQERFIDAIWAPVLEASKQLHRAAAFVGRVEDWHDDFFNDCTPSKDMKEAATKLDLALGGMADRPLVKVAEQARAYLLWLADPEGTGETLPECDGNPDECSLCLLEKRLNEAGF